MSRIRIFLGFIAVLFAFSLWGCIGGLPDDGSDDSSRDTSDGGSWDTSDEKITSPNFQAALESIAKDQPLIEDIPEIPIPSELLALDISQAREMVAAMQEFNKFKTFSQTALPAFLLMDTAKRPSTAKSGDMTVKCFGDQGCMYSWKENNGQLTVSMMQVNTPDTWSYMILLDGFGGVYHYNNYLSSSYSIKKDLSFMSSMLYQNPDNPDCPSGLLASYTMQKEEASDVPIFDSSGQSIPTTTYIYTWTTFLWDIFDEYYRPDMMSIITILPDGTTQLEQYFWSHSQDGLYKMSMSTVADDCRSGRTIYYDDEGNIKKVEDWGS